MDRLLFDFSTDGSGALTRSLDHASTTGFIGDDAPHWSIESFLPLQVGPLVDYLIARGELDDGQKDKLRRACHEIESILRERTSSYHTRFSEAYPPIDPDMDTRNPLDVAQARNVEPAAQVDAGPVESHAVDGGSDDKHGALDEAEGTDPRQHSYETQIAEVVELCEEMMLEAGYQRLLQDDIEQCVGVSSQWSVPLHVDFQLFHRLVVFARGDIIGTRLRRRLRKLYRPETVSVPIYQRMVVLFQLRDDDLSDENLVASALHLRMFKNIPQQDIDMLLPGTRVRITGVDRVKIIVPSLGGFLMSLRKIAQYALIFAALALHWTAILVGLVLGYLVKSVMSYFQTKNRYQLNLTRNLYFQKLDTNAGVAYRLIQQAHRQSTAEMILAFYAALSNGEPISKRRLRRRCERITREAIDVEVDFQIDRTLNRLAEIGVVVEEEGRWRVA